jgi:hypothetical protein
MLALLTRSSLRLRLPGARAVSVDAAAAAATAVAAGLGGFLVSQLTQQDKLTKSKDDAVKELTKSKDDAVKELTKSKDDAVKELTLELTQSKDDAVKELTKSKDDAVKEWMIKAISAEALVAQRTADVDHLKGRVDIRSAVEASLEEIDGKLNIPGRGLSRLPNTLFSAAAGKDPHPCPGLLDLVRQAAKDNKVTENGLMQTGRQIYTILSLPMHGNSTDNSSDTLKVNMESLTGNREAAIIVGLLLGMTGRVPFYYNGGSAYKDIKLPPPSSVAELCKCATPSAASAASATTASTP